MANHILSRIAMVALACATTQAAVAGEQALECKMVLKNIDVKSLEVAQVEGQTVGVSKSFGVATFADGRIATKDFTYSWDTNKGNGSFSGYSTYTFQDGSSITARYVGTARSGQPARGEYTVLSGTGAYAGAKGTGSFESIPSKLTAGLYNCKFAITTP